MADKIGHSEAETRTELKKVSEVLAGFLEDILMNWRSEPPKSRLWAALPVLRGLVGSLSLFFSGVLDQLRNLCRGLFPSERGVVTVDGRTRILWSVLSCCQRFSSGQT